MRSIWITVKTEESGGQIKESNQRSSLIPQTQIQSLANAAGTGARNTTKDGRLFCIYCAETALKHTYCTDANVQTCRHQGHRMAIKKQLELCCWICQMSSLVRRWGKWDGGWWTASRHMGVFLILSDRIKYKYTQTVNSSSQSAREYLMTGITWQLMKQAGGGEGVMTGVCGWWKVICYCGTGEEPKETTCNAPAMWHIWNTYNNIMLYS